MNNELAYAQIMNMFRYYYKNKWAPDSIFNGKSRLWIKCFNELVEKGYIKKRKQYPGFDYKWASVWPEHF